MSSTLVHSPFEVTLPYNSNDAHIWTNKDPDLELIEPRILVSMNRNYLVFGRKLGRPPQNHQVTLVNHGENPVAFKVLTTDNYAYFVNHVFGVIPGRHLHAIPHLRAPNQFILQVNRRPYNCFCDEQQPSHWNTPRKDKLFILLAPVFSFSIPPASLFHHESAYEKLRMCLEYTGMPVDPAKDVSLIFKKFPGWCTWKIEKKKEGTTEQFLGKSRKEAMSMITNVPSLKPLVFEDIPDVLPADMSKKKRMGKTEKRVKKDDKAKVQDAQGEHALRASSENVNKSGKKTAASYRGSKARTSTRAQLSDQLKELDITPSSTSRRSNTDKEAQEGQQNVTPSVVKKSDVAFRKGSKERNPVWKKLGK